MMRRLLALVLCLLPSLALAGSSLPPFGAGSGVALGGVSTTIGAVASGLNSPRTSTPPPYQLMGVSPELGIIGSEDEGYSTDSTTYGYIFGRTAIAKVRRSDVLPGAPGTPTPLITNANVVTQCAPTGTASSPSTGAPNHSGSGSSPFTDPTYGEVVAVPIDYYTNITTFGSDHICLFKTADLSFVRSIDISAGVVTADGGAAGITLIPGGGLSGGNAFGVIRYGQQTTSVWIYDYATSVSSGTGNLLQRVTVAASSISSGQGVTYKDGKLYLIAQKFNFTSTAVNGLYSIPLPSLSDCGTQASPCISSPQAVTTIMTWPNVAAPESVVFDSGVGMFAAMVQHTYYSGINANNNIYYLAPPTATPLFARAIDMMADGTSLYHTLGRFPTGLTVGGEFAIDYAPPVRGIRSGGAISIGCIPQSDVALLNICALTKTGLSATMQLQTYGQAHPGNGGIVVTDDQFNYGYYWTGLFAKNSVGTVGTADIKLAVDVDGHLRVSSGAPTTSTTGATVSGTPTNVAGAFNVPSGATQLVVTFAVSSRAWDVAPACVANLDTAAPVGVTETTTTVTFTFAALGAAGKLRYHCIEAK
jgi:hypothetical protein